MSIEYNLVLVPGKLKKLALTENTVKIEFELGLLVTPESKVDIDSISKEELQTSIGLLRSTSVTVANSLPSSIKLLKINGGNSFLIDTEAIKVDSLFDGDKDLCWKNEKDQAFLGDSPEGVKSIKKSGIEIEYLDANILAYKDANESQKLAFNKLRSLGSISVFSDTDVVSLKNEADSYLKSIEQKRETARAYEEFFERIYLEIEEEQKIDTSMNLKKLYNILAQEPDLLIELGFIQFGTVSLEVKRSALTSKENILDAKDWFDINPPETPVIGSVEKINTICSLVKDENDIHVYVGANRERENGKYVNKYGLLKTAPNGSNILTILSEHPINHENRNESLIANQQDLLFAMKSSKDKSELNKLVHEFLSNADVESSTGIHVFFNEPRLFPDVLGHPLDYTMSGHVPIAMHGDTIYSLSRHKGTYTQIDHTYIRHDGVQINVSQETNDGVALSDPLMYKWTGNNFAIDFYGSHESEGAGSGAGELEETFILENISKKVKNLIEGTNLPLYHGHNYAFSCIENPMFSSLFMNESDFEQKKGTVDEISFSGGIKPLTVSSMVELFSEEQFFSDWFEYLVKDEINPPLLIPHDTTSDVSDDNSSQIIIKHGWNSNQRSSRKKVYEIAPPKGDVELCVALKFFNGKDDFGKKYQWLKRAEKPVPKTWNETIWSNKVPYLMDPRAEAVQISLADDVIKDSRLGISAAPVIGTFKKGAFDYQSLRLTVDAEKNPKAMEEADIIQISNDKVTISLNPGSIEGFRMNTRSSGAGVREADAEFRIINAVSTYKLGDMGEIGEEKVQLIGNTLLIEGGYLIPEVHFQRNHQIAGAVQLWRKYTDVNPAKIDELQPYTAFAKEFKREERLNNHVREADKLIDQFDPMNIYTLEEVFGKEITEVIQLQEKSASFTSKINNLMVDGSNFESPEDEVVKDAFPLPYRRLTTIDSTITKYADLKIKDDERGKRQEICSKTYSRHLHYYKPEIEKAETDPEFDIRDIAFDQELDAGSGHSFLPYNAGHANKQAELIPEKIACDIKLVNYREDITHDIHDREIQSKSYFMIELPRKSVNKYCNEELYGIVLEDLILGNDFTTSNTIPKSSTIYNQKGRLLADEINLPLLLEPYVENKELAGTRGRKISLVDDRAGQVIMDGDKEVYYLIEPYLMYTEDKVIALFNLKDVDWINKLNNPFLKFSMVRLTKKTNVASQSVEDYHISEPSEPEYVQIQSKRHFSIKHIDRPHKYRIEIKDKVERNKVENGSKESVFYVALSNRQDNNLDREYKESLYEEKGERALMHKLTFGEEGFVEFTLKNAGVGAKVLNIFEFEAYKNLESELETATPLSDSRYKLIFSANYKE